VLGGGSSSSLRTVASARRRSFETTVTLGAQGYVAVQALDGRGHVLGSSVAIRPK
jgi:hypothetical protein